MDLNQRKLNKSEWNSIEIPVSEEEISILNLIMSGLTNVNIKINNHQSLFTFLKIEYNVKMEDYIYNKYFKELINEMLQKYKVSYIQININSDVQIKSADKIRLEKNNEKTIKTQEIYEFVLMKHLEQIYKASYEINSMLSKKEKEKESIWVKELDKEWNKQNKLLNFHYFTLYKLIKNNIIKINRHILEIVNKTLDHYNKEEHKNEIKIETIIENAIDYIEKNENLLKYGDMTLYEHQKEIFTICRNIHTPKLILYMAPTGTGKTLTPISLSQTKKVVFVCAARHVGLALARAAISVHKKIAFAFGCSSADDIRLHYFAAKVYTKNKRTGGIGKVDNSVGDDVEIIICDIKSYLPAMYYMLAFNSVENLLVYWDEPTITLDYEHHDFHEIIKKNWKENLIQDMVLSSATLPKQHELTQTISDFKNKFRSAQIFNIVSNDCKKSIPIINKSGYVVLPHILSDDYHEVLKIANHCENYLTLLRYLDLQEVSEFIIYVNKNNYVNSKFKLERSFECIDEITMTSIKIYYIRLLQNIVPESWPAIYHYFKVIRQPRIKSNDTIDAKGNKIFKTKSIGPGIIPFNDSSYSSLNAGKQLTRLASEQPLSVTKPIVTEENPNAGIYVTTKDAYTLTDGPTIFISQDVEKIAKFCIQQANIPAKVMEDLMEKIEYNNVLNSKLNILEKELEDITERLESSIDNNVDHGRNKSSKNCRKINRETEEVSSSKPDVNKITNQINVIRSMIKSAVLNDTFIPNKKHHLNKWAEDIHSLGAFTSNIEDSVVNEIMLLHGIEDSWKVLLMMGIGVFTNHENITYTEIMKKMADEQKLYMIIASSDYIYGTNYQFCHGYISKDLNLTQEKIIQAMGRIGRNNIQQRYTIRFRDDAQILKIFTNDTCKPEIINMNLLFNSNSIKWDGSNYVDVDME